MKFRTGFVTNSSSSSFLIFNVKHPQLYNFLTTLGIKVKNTEKYIFTDSTKIILPNGESSELCEVDPDWIPTPQEMSSITAWLMGVMLAEVESLYPPKQQDEYTNFTLTLLQLLNDKGIINIDMNDVESWDRDMLYNALSTFDKMDTTIEEAEIELDTGFEGEIIHLETVSAKNGYSLSISIDEYDTEEIDETLNGAHIVLVGNENEYKNKTQLINLIETGKAVYNYSVTEDTDYVICNNVSTKNPELTKAREWCIPIISEDGFMYRFGDKSKFAKDIYEELFECTYEGDFYEMFYQYGIGNVTRIKPNESEKIS